MADDLYVEIRGNEIDGYYVRLHVGSEPTNPFVWPRRSSLKQARKRARRLLETERKRRATAHTEIVRPMREEPETPILREEPETPIPPGRRA